MVYNPKPIPCVVLPQGPRSTELAALIRERVQYCIQQHRALDVQAAMAGVMPLLSSLISVSKGKGKREGEECKGKREGEECSEADAWQTQLQLAFQLLMEAIGTKLPL